MPKAKSKSKSKNTQAKTRIVIEACKSWGVFKRSAAKIQAILGKDHGEIAVNPGWDNLPRNEKDQKCKPRKGTFEIRVGGKPVLSLVGMKRPFKALRELDLEDVAGLCEMKK